MTVTDSADLVSIPALLARNAREFGDKAAYREKEFGIWQSWTWLEAVEQVEALALGLLSLGAEKGTMWPSPAATVRTSIGPCWQLNQSALCPYQFTKTRWEMRLPMF